MKVKLGERDMFLLLSYLCEFAKVDGNNPHCEGTAIGGCRFLSLNF